MDKIWNFGFVLAIFILIIRKGAEASSVGSRVRRGFGGYSDSFAYPRQMTYDELNRNQNIALWSAQSAVTSSVGQVYGNQQAALAHYVHQYTAPLAKSKSNGHRGRNSNGSKYNRGHGPVTPVSHPGKDQTQHLPRHSDESSRDRYSPDDTSHHPSERSSKQQSGQWKGRNEPSRRNNHRRSPSRKPKSQSRIQM